MATENIIMRMVKLGASRQDVHEAIRQHSQAAGFKVKNEGESNDLIERIKKDPFFEKIWGELDELLRPETFVGRAPEQTRAFVERQVQEALKPWKDEVEKTVEVTLKV